MNMTCKQFIQLFAILRNIEHKLKVILVHVLLNVTKLCNNLSKLLYVFNKCI